MPALKKISYPNFYFYDVANKKQVKLDATKDTVRLHKGSTKGRGPGKYFRVAGTKNGQKFSRMIDEDTYTKLKEKLKTKSPKKSTKKSKKPKKSLCNRSKSNVKKSKTKCMKSKTCTWVSGKKGSRKGYCRRGSRK